MDTLRLAIAQINTIVGDLLGNTEKVLFCIERAAKKDTDIIAFPELTITGYPPEGLVLKPHFIKENLKCLDAIQKATKDIVVVLGFVDQDKKGVYNSAAVISNKKIYYKYHKMELPNYSVFDEKRYFKPGTENAILRTRDFSFCVNICEDIWASREDLTTKQVLKQVQFLVNISASPYHVDKVKERHAVLAKKIDSFKLPIAYCNLIGGQDELVFDGRSAIFSKDGKLISQAKAFEEDLMFCDLPIAPLKTRKAKAKSITIDYTAKKKKCALPKQTVKDIKGIEEIYFALLVGIRDYVKKNNFKKVALGLSGGIDSALVAALAVDALGKANVIAFSMPSKYSSKDTQDDAGRIAKNLGIRFAKVNIDKVFDAYIDTLSSHFTGMDPDITEENIQARIRGNILMAFSNKFGCLVLNTGNKSETSVGYCTLYGDMAGGFAVIKDILKNLVYKLARHVNNRKGKTVIPKSVFKRPPSAELRPGQKDQDSLPAYKILDEIIGLYIEEGSSFNDIVKKIGKKDVVKKVLRMIDVNEYKRRQAPPGIKITPCSFGKDRRMPITNRYIDGGVV
ncbi:MAG: NAD+ synthase [Candidatus Omnitrophica bacterium]|nr:NAD+ synthase [Candidatus Omnitrophota bacterium]MBU4589656.1 NAD+ synthase [Candidatus Omnitrophota bacterium]